MLITGLLILTYLLKKQDDTRSILYATRTTMGLSSISIDFRENNTYKLGVHHFMATDYTRGRYTKNDSTIYLDKPFLSNNLVSNKLILKTIPMADSLKNKKQNWLLTLLLGKNSIDTTPETFLFQVNERGQIIKDALSFKLTHKLID
jgi:hypothetical protein